MMFLSAWIHLYNPNHAYIPLFVTKGSMCNLHEKRARACVWYLRMIYVHGKRNQILEVKKKKKRLCKRTLQRFERAYNACIYNPYYIVIYH